MIIAIDNIDYISKLKGNEIIYVFDEEPLDVLISYNLHCIHKDYIEEVDINITKYDIPCKKKCTIDDDLTLPKKMNYKYAIIIPNYNNDHGNYKGKTFLRNCIESVLYQTYTDFELIIVDDMSEDTSVETIKSYNDKRIHLIQNKRKRYNGGSRNVGIDYALDNFDFNYFCFLDSDDWWLDNRVLEHINDKLFNHELMTLGCICMGVDYKTYNAVKKYVDLFDLHPGSAWCTAWSRVIRKDKIVHFCEDTLMEDRVWNYKQSDNINFENVINLNRYVYCWNRTNTNNSVSLTRSDFWNASTWCHIGHSKQAIIQMKHQEIVPLIKERINKCIRDVLKGIYKQT